ITASKVTCHNVTLNWTPATDNISAQSKLSYLAYYSLSSSMNTVSDIESHGSAYGSYTENISSNNITGLDLSTDYYFNVIVMDEAENKSCYSMVNQKTRDKAYMVSDINPEGSSVPSDFIIFNGLLYFNADNGTNGRELWHYDSVSDSAGFIDIKTGTEGSNPSYPQEFNGKIYFNADGDSNGRELWSYNGINAPSLVYNINPGSGSR
ncbi:MAG: hypothetical protein JXB50_12580, partial [Spirochaetes bacterium]|nr:hypothetical protein [Spirochaetota bacterium]